MKSALETLNPTRVRLTVEVPFEELKPSLDAAYKKIGTQVQVPGFRRGKVPPRLIDQRFGRGVVLEEAINEALPKFYGQAVQENNVVVMGQPEVDVTELNDGQNLTFTAEVDVRPEFELPSFDDLQVTVDDIEVTDEEVDAQLQQLRERFGTLKGVDRPAEEGDFLSIDMSASVNGEEVDSVSGLSYQVGSKNLLDGLDDAVRGMSAGDATTFHSTLAGGEHQGEDAEISVTVKSVKERELPEVDDDFASIASEFDTVEELRADTRTRVERDKLLGQGFQARDRALEAFLARVDFPLPEGLVRQEVEGRQHNLEHELEAGGITKEQYLQAEEKDQAALDSEIEERAREALKAQLVLDRLAGQENIQPTQEELTEHLILSAQRYGMAPEEFAQQLVQGGNVQVLIAELIRGKALALILEKATVTDASGNAVDLSALGEADEDDVEAADNDIEPGESAGHEADVDDVEARVADSEDAAGVETGQAETGQAETGGAETGDAEDVEASQQSGEAPPAEGQHSEASRDDQPQPQG